MVYVVQEGDAGIYKDWAPPFDSKYYPKTRGDVILNIKMHQLMGRSYTRAREYQNMCGVDENDDDEEDASSPGFNESQKEVEKYLEYINAIPCRPRMRLRAQSEPSAPKLDESLPPQLPGSEPSTPTRRRWRRYLSLNSAKPPSLSPVKLWKRTTSLPTTLATFQFPVLPMPPMPPLPSVSLKGRVPFPRFRRTRSSPTPVKEELHRVVSAPTSPPAEVDKKPVDKKARRNTVNDGDATMARARRENFGSTPAPITPINNKPSTPTSTPNPTPTPSPANADSAPLPSTPKRKKNSVDDRRKSTGSERRVKFPTKPVPLQLDLSASFSIGTKSAGTSSTPSTPTTPPIPSSPLETTATCPYSIRQRPLPPDEWFGFNVNKAPVDEKPQPERPTAYDALYIMFMPLLAMISFIVVAILTLPVWCVCTPLEWFRNRVRAPVLEIEKPRLNGLAPSFLSARRL